MCTNNKVFSKVFSVAAPLPTDHLPSALTLQTVETRLLPTTGTLKTFQYSLAGFSWLTTDWSFGYLSNCGSSAMDQGKAHEKGQCIFFHQLTQFGEEAEGLLDEQGLLHHSGFLWSLSFQGISAHGQS